jgi:hypothetical protein
MFWIQSPRHQCSLMPLEEISIKYKLVPVEGKAGYHRIKISSKTSQCPICKNKYTYDSKQELLPEYISWDEVHKAKKRK